MAIQVRRGASLAGIALIFATVGLGACGDDATDEPKALAKCGNGTIEGAEQCDDGAANSDSQPGACRTSCKRAWCGDGVLDTGEDCDGIDLSGNTCSSEGFAIGTLSCSATCKLDTSACSSCGNGTLEGAEKCDGQEMGDATCATAASKQHGVLTCNADCDFDTTLCHTCGDGTVESAASEECEPSDLGGQTCKTLQQPKYAYGELACTSETCKLDDDDCRAFCGNGVIEGDEQCDRGDVPSGTTCSDLTAGALPSGDVTCAPSCLLSSLQCHACGNNHKDHNEECDGSDLGGVTCETLWGGGSTGTLGCTQDCRFDSVLCVPATTCGDGKVDPGEQCDGANLGGKTCASLAVYGGGHLACLPNCLFDTSACEPVPCGNGEVDGDYGEQCDGTHLGGVSCTSLGFAGGALECTKWCTFDMSACTPAPACGNGDVEDGEDCDGFAPEGLTCQDLGFLPGGNIQCASNCQLDVSNCVRCGDGRLDWEEECDTDQLRGLTCSDFGRFGGALGCKLDCTFDTSGCNDCGNGSIDTGEDCEPSDLNGATCAGIGPTYPDGEPTCDPDTCKVDASMCHNCGNGQLEGPEDCDPLPTTSCADEGYSDGLALCNANCVGVDTSGCWKANDGDCNVGAGETFANSAADCGWRQIAAGQYGTTCAIKNDGAVFCWGGSGSHGYPPMPTRVTLPDGAVQVSVGAGHRCAVASNGRVYCWGAGDHGQLGNGANLNSDDPVEVSTIMGAVGVVAAQDFSCAWQSTGAAWCWGSDDNGQLGNGADPNHTNVPLLLSGGGAVAQISAKYNENGYTAVLARRTDGSVLGWSSNLSGALGLGSISSYVESPTIVPLLGNGNTYVSSGSDSTCVVKSSGGIVCSGSDAGGTLGNGASLSSTNVHGSIDVSTGLTEAAVQVEASRHHTCARTTSGVVWCWGANAFGELGLGATSADEQSPTEVTALSLPAIDIATANQPTAPSYTGHSCAILNDGSAWCWGYGGYGQLGNGDTSDHSLPVQVSEPSN